MNIKIKDKWVSALRSGEYKQGIGKLANKKTDGEILYCCLGVLCEILLWHPELGVIVTTSPNDQLVYNMNRYSLEESIYIPCGLEDGNPSILDRKGDRTTLAVLNDSRVSFKEIADLIETQY